VAESTGWSWRKQPESVQGRMIVRLAH